MYSFRFCSGCKRIYHVPDEVTGTVVDHKITLRIFNDTKKWFKSLMSWLSFEFTTNQQLYWKDKMVQKSEKELKYVFMWILFIWLDKLYKNEQDTSERNEGNVIVTEQHRPYFFRCSAVEAEIWMPLSLLPWMWPSYLLSKEETHISDTSILPLWSMNE